MRPDRKNIDQNLQLPENISFREEVIWSKIQLKKKSNKPFVWIAAASVTLALMISFFFQLKEKTLIPAEAYFLTTEIKTSGFDILNVPSDLITENPDKIHDAEKNPIITDEIKKSSVASQITMEKSISIETEIITPSKNEVSLLDFESQELTKETNNALSLSAQRLKVNLDKVDLQREIPEKVIFQTKNLADFFGANRSTTLAKDMPRRQESIISILIRGNYENN